MHKIVVNGVEIFPFSSEAQLLNYVNERKGILIAINAEKILNATKETRKNFYEKPSEDAYIMSRVQ